MTATIDKQQLASPPYARRWAAFFVIVIGSVMELLDATVTNIAGPSVQADIGGGSALIQWLGVAYTLAVTAGLLTGGRLGDIVGRKRMFLIGLTGFVAGSLACAMSGSPEIIIIARVLQGLFGAAMIPQGLGMLKEMFPPNELPKAFGAFGPIMGLSTVLGPVLAGWLIEADLFGTGWRMIFLINLPIGLIAGLAAIRFLPPNAPTRSLKLDLPGAALASFGTLLIVFPLVQGREFGWPEWVFVLMAASVLVFILFGRFELWKTRRGGDPLVVPSLFRKRSFVAGLLTGAVFFAAFVGFMLVFNLYTQIGLGYSPLKAGLMAVPMSIGVVIGMVLVQALRSQGRRLIHFGGAIMIVGIVTLVLLIEPGVNPWLLTPALLVSGLGTGLMMGPYFDIVLAGVEPHESGSAAGALTSIQQVGAAIGVALLGTVYFDSGASDPTTAARLTFWVAAAMTAVTFLVAFLLPKHMAQTQD
jgi:EmrB/QacA subfamily drug resistance transporter